MASDPSVGLCDGTVALRPGRASLAHHGYSGGPSEAPRSRGAHQQTLCLHTAAIRRSPLCRRTTTSSTACAAGRRRIAAAEPRGRSPPAAHAASTALGVRFAWRGCPTAAPGVSRAPPARRVTRVQGSACRQLGLAGCARPPICSARPRTRQDRTYRRRSTRVKKLPGSEGSSNTPFGSTEPERRPGRTPTAVFDDRGMLHDDFFDDDSRSRSRTTPRCPPPERHGKFLVKMALGMPMTKNAVPDGLSVLGRQRARSKPSGERRAHRCGT